MTKAEETCITFDTEVYKNSTFLSYEDALILKQFSERWLRNAETIIKQGPDDGDDIPF